MSQKPETVFRQKVQKALDKIPHAWFESIQQKAIGGTPDILGCVNGFFVALELKADTKSTVSKLQEYKLKQIANANGLGFVVNPSNWLSTLELLHGLSKKDPTQITAAATQNQG